MADGRPPAPGERGQASAELVGLTLVVALLLLAVRGPITDAGAALARLVAGVLGGQTAAHVAREGPGADAVVEAALSRERGAPSVAGARFVLRDALGPAAGEQAFRAAALAWAGRHVRGWDAAVRVLVYDYGNTPWQHWYRLTAPRAGGTVVRVVTPDDERGATGAGTDGAAVLGRWIAGQVRGATVSLVGRALSETGDGGVRVPGALGAVGVAASVVGILRTESDEHWPGPGARAGDVVLCRAVRTAWQQEEFAPDDVTDGVRTVIVRDGLVIADAVSTSVRSCDGLGS